MQEWDGEQRAERRSKHVVRLTELPPSGNAAYPVTVDLKLDPRTGRPVSITLRADEGFTATDLKRLPWKQWLWVADVLLRFGDEDQPERIEGIDARIPLAGTPRPEGYPDSEEKQRRPGRRGHPEAHYREVAKQYRDLVAAGTHRPTALIAEEWGYSRNTVAGWIRIARQRGFLPPSRPGRAG